MRLPENFPPLCEILDSRNRPFMLTSPENALAQGLRHRAFAVLLQDDASYILRRRSLGFGFCLRAHLPPDLTAPEAAARALAAAFGETACRVLRRLEPEPPHDAALTEICAASIGKRQALELRGDARDWLFLSRDELFALRCEGLYEPFFARALACALSA